MKRDLDALADGRFDLVVAGGGVVGASIARDAARRGLRVALVEADDFAHAASEGMSHFVHGGIRYLATGEFGQVRKSLRERATWMRIAPHQIVAQPCLTPIAGKSRFEGVALAAAVHLFNVLGGRNVLPRDARPPVRLTAAEAVRAEPAVEQAGLTGALVYHDCRVDEPERVVVGLLQDAAAHGAVIANHARCLSLRTEGGKVGAVEVRDEIGGGTLTIRAEALVNATGPWAEVLASQLLAGQAQVALTLSKGIHVVTGPVAATHSLNLAGHHEHATVLPWRGFSLIGTTDEPIKGDADGAAATEADVETLLAKIARLLPSTTGRLGPVLDSYAAVRALPGRVSDTYGASREDALSDHAKDGAAGFLSVYGGKWTTARLMAEHAVDRVVARLGRTARLCDTATAPLLDAPASPPDTFRAAWRTSLRDWPRDEADAWASAYGTRLSAVLKALPDLATADVFARENARFAHAAAEEMAVLPADFARRMARWYRLARPGVEARAAIWLAANRKLADAGAGT